MTKTQFLIRLRVLCGLLFKSSLFSSVRPRAQRYRFESGQVVKKETPRIICTEGHKDHKELQSVENDSPHRSSTTKEATGPTDPAMALMLFQEGPYGTSAQDIGVRPWLVGPVGLQGSVEQLGMNSGPGLETIELKESA